VREPVAHTPPPTTNAPERRSRVVVTDTSVEALDPIEFLSGSPTLQPQSFRLLESLASTLIDNPSIELVAVHAYADDALPQFRVPLASERASRLVKFLVDHGVPPTRLVTRGEPTAPAGQRSLASFEILRRQP
jgi:outer membrane protein OmpA-like peptidoglycan-associated protein